MKCMPTLIFLQASREEIEAWMSGIMQCKLKSIWINTPQKQQRSCIMTSFGFSSKMRNLYPRPRIIVMWILRNFQQVKNKDRCSQFGDSTHVGGSQCLAKNSSVQLTRSLDTVPVFVTKRSKHPSRQEDQKHINYKQELCMHKRKPNAATLKVTVAVMVPPALRSRCSTHKPVQRRFPHQLTS